MCICRIPNIWSKYFRKEDIFVRSVFGLHVINRLQAQYLFTFYDPVIRLQIKYTFLRGPVNGPQI